VELCVLHAVFAKLRLGACIELGNPFQGEEKNQDCNKRIFPE